MAGALDFPRKLALMFGTGACLAARADFTLFGDEAAQKVGVFIIDVCAFFNTKLANLRA